MTGTACGQGLWPPGTTAPVLGSLLAGFSVGLFYLPSAVAMAVAAGRG